ncbi:MAG: RNA ligase family protein [Planctomycetaceae bacterium]|jgi:hypothetical protein|nr:RNA ligase family protein [Planctomycetaceae bacterium]
MRQPEIKKYPRTQHLEGSRLQPGDEDLESIPFRKIQGLTLVVEEKMDGANCGFSFDDNGQILLQSRGHYLIGGVREKHFQLFKKWAATHQQAFWEVIGSRYIVYGEWLYAKHTIFYDALPHYFLEFDIYDRQTDNYLDTPSRYELLKTLPIASVPVLRTGSFRTLKDLTELIDHSLYICDDHIEQMLQFCKKENIDQEIALRETDLSVTAEGLYIKHEQEGHVIGRFKFVRSQFLQTAITSGSHWLARPIIPNILARKFEDLFQPKLPMFSKESIETL